MWRNLQKITFASAVLLALVIVTLWINIISNGALRKEVTQSVVYVSQLKGVIDKLLAVRSREAIHSHTRQPRCLDPDWSHLDFESLSAQQLVDYFLWANRTSCKIVNDFGGIMVGKRTRVGYDAHKAICLDREVAPVPDRCLAYSFGINFDWSFDEDMELYGCKVLSFDPSMDVRNQTRSVSIEFYRMGINDRDRWDDPRWPNVPMLTLNSFYELFKPVHGEVVIDYLKLDVEGAEWTVIPQLLRTGMLDKVRQLSAEFHLPNNMTLQEFRSYAAIVRSLESYGMIRFDCKPHLQSVTKLTNLGLTAIDNYEIAFYNSKHIRRNVNIDSLI